MNNNILDKAYDIYFQSVSEHAESKFELALWSAWGSGAIVIDGGLTKIPGYELIPDSLDKAKQLVNLLIQPMVSFWYHNWEKQELHSGEEMLEARKSAYENVQVFLDILSLQTLPIQLILDSELTYFVNGLRNSVVYYIGMFHQRYRECLMGEPIVEWNKLKVPIDTWGEFQSHCDRNKYKYLDMNSSLATFSLITDASARMFQEFKRLYEQK